MGLNMLICTLFHLGRLLFHFPADPRRSTPLIKKLKQARLKPNQGRTFKLSPPISVDHRSNWVKIEGPLPFAEQ
jgi:hypothetical protein